MKDSWAEICTLYYGKKIWPRFTNSHQKTQTLRMHESYKINRTIPDTIERWASVITLNSFQTWNDNLQIKVSHLLTRPGPKIDQICLQFLIWFSGRNSLWSGKWALSLTGPYTLTWDIAETTNSSSSEIMVCNCEHVYTWEKTRVLRWCMYIGLGTQNI